MAVLLLLLGSDAGDLKPDAVHAGEGGDVEGAGVVVSPGEVVRRLGQP
jgi:membrane protein involved in colicin uptake